MLKHEWIKVKYNNVTKRFHNLPSDLEVLKRMVCSRFGLLKHDYQPSDLAILAELPKTGKIARAPELPLSTS